MSRYRVTVDTGGTFSDFVYLDEATGEVTIAKIPSTPDDPSRAILQGIEGLLAKGVEAPDIGFFCHGTTVGTNALLEGKGVRTGLLVTKGFEIGDDDRITIGAGVNTVSKRLGETATKFFLPSYTLVRALASYEPNDKVKISLDVTNLFDKVWYASSYSQFWVQPGAPRTFTGRVTFKF